jgi:hypothetical protein
MRHEWHELSLVPPNKEVAMIERKELSREDIAHRAYELYTQRGCEPGKDIEDWVRAEKELASEFLAGRAKTMAASLGRIQNN